MYAQSETYTTPSAADWNYATSCDSRELNQIMRSL